MSTLGGEASAGQQHCWGPSSAPLAYRIRLFSGRQCCGAWPVMVNSSSRMCKPSCSTLNSRDLPIQRKRGNASFIALKYFSEDARPRALGWLPQELNHRERTDFLGKWSAVPVSWAPRQSNGSCGPGSGCCPLRPAQVHRQARAMGGHTAWWRARCPAGLHLGPHDGTETSWVGLPLVLQLFTARALAAPSGTKGYGI